MSIAAIEEQSRPLVVELEAELERAKREESQAQGAFRALQEAETRARERIAGATRRLEQAREADDVERAQADLDAAYHEVASLTGPDAKGRFAAARARVNVAPTHVQQTASRLAQVKLEGRQARHAVDVWKAKLRELANERARLLAEVERIDKGQVPHVRAQLEQAARAVERLTGEVVPVDDV